MARAQSPTKDRITRNIEFVECRTLGHAWEQIPRKVREHDWSGYGFALRCVRCGCERFDDFDHLGQLSHRKYDHPEGYHMARDETPDRSSMRLVFARVHRIKYRGEENGN